MKKKCCLLFGLSGGLLCGSLLLAEEPAKSAPATDAGVAAYINDQPVTTAQLDEKVLKTNMKLAQQLYDARKAALDLVILDLAFSKEAGEKKITVDEIIEAKIAEKARPVSDADVQEYYIANQARMGGKTQEQIAPQIRNYLAGQRTSEARNAVLEDVRKNSKVRILLDVPRVEIALAANDPIKGGANAKVTVIEFSDFQ